MFIFIVKLLKMDNEIYTFIIKGLNKKIAINVPGDTKISQLFEKYLEKIQKKNLLINNIDNIYFVYNAHRFNNNDLQKRVDEYFSLKQNDINAENSYNAKFNVEIIEPPISKNCFTSIYKGKIEDINGVKYVAVKKIYKNAIKNEMKLQQCKIEITEEEFKPEIEKFNKEIQNMEKCWCKNSVEIYDYFDTKDEFIIVMELCDDSLLGILKNKPSGGLSPIEIKEILLQLNKVFKLMNNNKISHRDIKLANILVKKEENNKIRVLLSDYGISNQLSLLTTKFMTHAGTILTMAPEILNFEKYDDKCDLWSLGVVIYQLYTRKYPYNGLCESEVLKNIDKKGQSVLDEIKDEKIKDLLSKLLVRNPKERISWEDYYKHSLFQEK